MKNVLVVGGGGREHALAWKLSQSKGIGQIFVAPGNGGTSQIAINVPITADKISELINFVKASDIYLTVVGPDAPLADGIVDQFQRAGLKIFGPTQKTAEIEWSKTYAKCLMKKYGIPTAEYQSFSDLEAARKYIETASFPVVVKADGLALGKGVFICKNHGEALQTLQAIGSKAVVIEEYLEGTELSAHAICDSENFLLFPLAQDHKRIGEGNTGPMTGGMGTICPIPESTTEIKEIIATTLAALKKEGRPFTGCLFPGIMLTKSGPKVLEFNARFGDPETQVYLRLLKTDLLEIFEAALEQRLNKLNLEWDEGAAACVVLASQGYPRKYKTGLEISGLEDVSGSDVMVFHAGTKKIGQKIRTAGGRVLNVTATGKNLAEGLNTAYAAVERVHFKGSYFRKDIGRQYATISS